MNKKIFLNIAVVALAVLMITIQSCKKDDPCADLGKVGGLLTNLTFPVAQDTILGAQVAHQVDSTYMDSILLESANPQAYAYLQSIVDDLLASEDILHRDLFKWKLTIIDQDVLNAFATPGGYIYVYTGLIKYLDNVDDLAGVMGHEIAHADRRHSVNQMIKSMKLAVVLSIIAGGDESSAIAQYIAGLVGTLKQLEFSREDEAEADAASVDYLDETDFACNGAAEFFRKIEAEGGAGVPEFLSTHPNPSNRINDIDSRASCRGCSTENSTVNINGMTYAEFKGLF
ncbi:M48 family metalloprotease [Marinoscillum sp. MHG1-6]|uniref:M48 family metalloprotease n=1 Tax=Marinoscillum sp. MHG1-6 TaxID=2959627 RepID=UPI0021579B3E|nr:M48 family metalloprotease [Marinoscillum sp. MHG1-6]